MADYSELLTVLQVSERLSVGQEAVRQWLRTGRLRGLKLPGGDWRIRPEDVADMLGIPAGVGGVGA